MKLYCLAAASLMLLGTAAAEEPNLRGVADTFKEQVAEALGNPDDIEMYQRECAHCEDCEGVDEESDSFLTYCKGRRFKQRCIRRGCISGDDGPPPPPKPQPRAPPKPRGPKCGNLSRHCFDCYCNEEGKDESSDSFLSYCNPRSCPDHCSESFDCDGGEERGHGGHGGHGGPGPRGPPNGGGGCSRYNGNPAQCAQNGCLPMGGMGGIKCGPGEDSGDVEMEDFPGEENGGPDDNEGEGNDNGWPDEEDEGNDYDNGDGDDYDEGGEGDYDNDESEGYQEGEREAMAHGEEESGCDGCH